MENPNRTLTYFVISSLIFITFDAVAPLVHVAVPIASRRSSVGSLVQRRHCSLFFSLFRCSLMLHIDAIESNNTNFQGLQDPAKLPTDAATVNTFIIHNKHVGKINSQERDTAINSLLQDP
ncbi:uncharacterized protein LOC114194268 [Vigna unguiculata]|uniref:uncharacterized protein LOC114194268 n=1 Tax=Vigna unguiculata TaxID=3917 RepID=UPI001016ABB1|nr:uncharacterized protein LOC114194268 [Vigna unguiculata]